MHRDAQSRLYGIPSARQSFGNLSLSLLDPRACSVSISDISERPRGEGMFTQDHGSNGDRRRTSTQGSRPLAPPAALAFSRHSVAAYLMGTDLAPGERRLRLRLVGGGVELINRILSSAISWGELSWQSTSWKLSVPYKEICRTEDR